MSEQFTVATLFSGFGLKTIGFRDAGFNPVLAVEYREDIAGVYADNLGAEHCHVADVRHFDYRPYAGVTMVAASPVCKNASGANPSASETELDRECGAATARAIDEMRPHWFVLENVAGYADFDAYKTITDKLDGLGYWWHASVLNSADFGVPQTRKRLILRATMDGYLPPLPSPTPWQGWYDAVAELLPGCEESTLAKWQLERLGEDFLEKFAGDAANKGGVPSGYGSDKLLLSSGCNPSPVVTATHTKHPFRAVLVEGDAAGERSPQVLEPDTPCFTLKASGGGRVHRAVVADSPRVRVVRLSTPCLGAIQSIPRWFKYADESLPGKAGTKNRTLNATGIGNGVACKVAEAIGKGFIQCA